MIPGGEIVIVLPVTCTLRTFVVYFKSINRESKIRCIYVGVMKDYKLKLRNLHASDTLGWSWNWNT